MDDMGCYHEMKLNKNNMSYWLPKIQGKGFNIPETVIVPISEKEFTWLRSDQYETEKIEEFSREIQKRILETGFNTDREMFIKTGNFSNKFVFRFPYLKDITKIGQQFLNVMYGGLCCGCEPSPELVVREFIHTSYLRKSIYYGMKLNTEFRCFYDFDSKKLLDIFNYWDTKTMINILYESEDKEAFLSECENIEFDFEYLKPVLREYISGKMNSIELDGIWSVDFMWDGEKFWLIDMALGKNSFYFDKLNI